MYYGNPAAIAASNGNNTFDFFDDFSGSSLNANWVTSAAGGTIAVAGGQVTLNNTNTGEVSILSAFTPGSPASFIIEAKHNEGAYHRNWFLAASNPVIDSPIWDYGYFNSSYSAENTAQDFWNGYGSGVFLKDTAYLTRWDITNAAAYTWSNYNYNSGVQINSQTTSTTKIIRYLIFAVGEQAGTSTSVDWARVRKAGTVEIATTVGSEISTLPVPTITGLGSSIGCVGTNITINGTGFTTAFALSVKIGGTPVSSIVSNNGTTIVAVIGAGTTGNVTVTTSGGTGSGSGTFTVNLLSTVSAGTTLTAICQGGTSSGLGGSVGGGATGGTWSDGGVGGTFSPAATTLNATWTPPVNYTGTVTLTLTAAGSCGNTAAAKTLVVNQVPAGAVSASAYFYLCRFTGNFYSPRRL